MAVNRYDDFKQQLEQEGNESGLILVLTDIEMGGQNTTVLPGGRVAIIGNPDDPPQINISDAKIAYAIFLSQSLTPGVPVKQLAFSCWGIDWLLNGTIRGVIFAAQHYGTLRIKYSVFGYTLPIAGEPHRSNYLSLKLENTPGHPIQNSILIANNRFMNMPGRDLGNLGSTSDIGVACYRLKSPGGMDGTCHHLGDVVIRDNTWQSPPGPEARNLQSYPSPYAPYSYRSAISLQNIVRATIFGNRAMGDNTTLSVVFRYSYPYEDAEAGAFNNTNLQLFNNTAQPGMSVTHRQFYFNGLKVVDGVYKDLPVAGLVNMTCNPWFNAVRLGSFAHNEKYSLTIIDKNDDCPAPSTASTALYPTLQTSIPLSTPTLQTSIPLSTLLVSTTTPLSSASPEVSSMASASGSSGILSIITITPTSAPSPYPGHEEEDEKEDGHKASIIAGYSARAAILGFIAWEVLWTGIYRFSSGNTRRIANAMALFIPYCLENYLIRSVTGDDAELLNSARED